MPPSSTTQLSDLELGADDFDPQRAAAIYREQGAVVLRGLMRGHVEHVLRDMQETLERAEASLPQAVKAKKYSGGWLTPDGSVFNEDPLHPGLMVINTLKFNALISGAFLWSLLDPRLLDVVEAILGPDIELWKWGQCVYRQPDSGVPKSLHHGKVGRRLGPDGPWTEASVRESRRCGGLLRRVDIASGLWLTVVRR